MAIHGVHACRHYLLSLHKYVAQESLKVCFEPFHNAVSTVLSTLGFMSEFKLKKSTVRDLYCLRGFGCGEFRDGEAQGGVSGAGGGLHDGPP